MAKSVRVSDDLYAVAEMTGEAMHRSLAQQIEHWAALGRAIEAAGLTTEQIGQVLSGNRRAQEKVMLRLGLARHEDMALIPADVAARTTVRFPELRRRRKAA